MVNLICCAQLALLLRELGEVEEVCSSLIDYVAASSQALHPAPSPHSNRSQKKQRVVELSEARKAAAATTTVTFAAATC